MPRRPDTFETVRVVLEILRRIPRSRKISAPELHSQLRAAGLDRDLRTVQRQLDALSDAFDIERDDRSKPYGYRWKEKAQALSLPGLNERESLLLALAELHLRNLLPASVTKSLEAFFEQARANLGLGTTAPKEREWLSKVRVVGTTQPLLPPDISPGVFEQVSNALYGNRWLDITYKSATGKNTRADVMPLGLAQQGVRLYLVGRFRGFSDDRSLALHRIFRARALTLTFDRPKEFDLGRFDDEGRFAFGSGKKVRLRFEIDADAGLHLVETPLSRDQVVKLRGGRYEVAATVTDSAQLTWWIQSFGKTIRRVRKDPLRQRRATNQRNTGSAHGSRR